jgi:hypothetical protein
VSGGRVFVILVVGLRLDPVEQQRGEPEVVDRLRVGDEDPRIVEVAVDPQDGEIFVLFLDEQHRGMGAGADLTGQLGGPVDVLDLVEVDLRGCPTLCGPGDDDGGVGHVPSSVR